MARINIEDSIHTDRRFFDLIIKLKDIDKAYGILVRMWIVAQKWYLTPEKMIPADEWKKQLIDDVVFETGWAERVGDFVRICGADKQFAWLDQRVDAGRRGGLTRRGKSLSPEESAKRQAARIMVSKAVKRGELVRPRACHDCGKEAEVQGHHTDYSKPLDVIWLCEKCHVETHRAFEEATAKRPLKSAKRPHSDAKPPSLFSSSLSSSDSSSNSNSENYSVGSVRSPAGFFIGRYVKAYQGRYGDRARPDLRGKVQGLIKRFLDDTPIERACGLIETYLSMNDAWFITKAHDFVTFQENLSKVGLKLDTGKSANTTQARAEEKLDATKDQMRRVMEGSL